MKRISKVEAIVAVIIIVTLMYGPYALNAVVLFFKSIRVDLFEILFAKHMTWFAVKGILGLLSGMGIWLGRAKSKLLFSIVLFLIVASFF